MHTTYLLLGTNLGDRLGHLIASKEAIEEQVGHIVATSAVYETAAWGVAGQPAYLNQVLQISTQFGPFELLHRTQAIEKKLGRTRVTKWESRIIDIDLLFFDQEVIHSAELDIPHPYLHQRRFTLEPLNEIAGHLVHPVLHKSVNNLLHALTDDLKVAKLTYS